MFGIQLPNQNEVEDVHFEVFPSNWPVISAFFALDGCAWQYSSMGDILGLDYLAAKVIWDGLGITVKPKTFAGVMLFTRTIVNILLKRKQD